MYTAHRIMFKKKKKKKTVPKVRRKAMLTKKSMSLGESFKAWWGGGHATAHWNSGIKWPPEKFANYPTLKFEPPLAMSNPNVKQR